MRPDRRPRKRARRRPAKVRRRPRLHRPTASRPRSPRTRRSPRSRARRRPQRAESRPFGVRPGQYPDADGSAEPAGRRDGQGLRLRGDRDRQHFRRGSRGVQGAFAQVLEAARRPLAGAEHARGAARLPEARRRARFRAGVDRGERLARRPGRAAGREKRARGVPALCAAGREVPRVANPRPDLHASRTWRAAKRRSGIPANRECLP